MLTDARCGCPSPRPSETWHEMYSPLFFDEPETVSRMVECERCGGVISPWTPTRDRMEDEP